MRIFVSLLLCFFSLAHAVGQKDEYLYIQLYGAVDAEPLSDVMVLSYDADNQQLDYTMTDGDGNATVSTQAGYVLCTYLGFKELKVETRSLKKGTRNKLYMEVSSIKLKEITVKAPPIREKNDTIVYLVDAFKSQSDRHIEDILKKLPGISVSSDGRISYQGETISRFYIEGQDLLGSNYNQATENIPVEAVANVEILEHNQNVRVLKDKVPEKKAALNIRLNKEYKQRPFGEAQAAFGAAPFIWDSRLFLTRIGTSGQTMVVAKTNNIGNDYTKDIDGQIDISDLGTFDFLPVTFISANRTTYGPVDITRMTDNKSFFAGISHLAKLSEYANLRINLLADKDITHSPSLYEYKYGGVYETSYRDISDINYNRYTVKPTVKYELNSDKVFLSDELTYSLTRNRQNLHLTTTAEEISQQTKTTPAWIQNRLKSTLPLGRLIFGFNSFTRYYSAGQWMELEEQSYDYNLRSFVTYNNLSTSFSLAGNTISTGIGINYKDNRYRSDSDITYSYIGINIPLSYTIRYSGPGYLSLGCNLSINRYRLKGLSFTDEKALFLPAPSIRLNQNIFKNLTMEISGSYSKNDVLADFYSEDVIRGDYRLRYKSLNALSFTSSYRTSLNINYRNLYHMFFSSLSVAFNHRKYDSYSESDYATDYTLLATLPGRTHRNNLFANLSADKTFTDAALAIRGEFGYNRFSFLIAQNGLLTDNKANTLNASVNVIFQKFKWITATIDFDVITSWQDNNAGKTDYLHTYKGKATLHVFPAPKWETSILLENFTNQIQPGQYKSSNFLDFTVTYRLSKKIFIEGEMKNILNNSKYAYSTENGLNWRYCELPLRGREAMIKCTVKF